MESQKEKFHHPCREKSLLSPHTYIGFFEVSLSVTVIVNFRFCWSWWLVAQLDEKQNPTNAESWPIWTNHAVRELAEFSIRGPTKEAARSLRWSGRWDSNPRTARLEA
jgi:hypothetical protein